MAMTKKERAEIDALVKKLRISGALRWTEEVKPDVPIPKGWQGLSKGWLPRAWDGTAEPACSSAVHHARGQNDKTTSQGAKELYSTRLLALKAARHQVEMEAAEKLAQIDERIEAEYRLAEANK